MEGSLNPVRIAIIGGGAAGIFAAISAKEENPSALVSVFEKSNRFLAKVRISGGGRCNVTHACFDPRELVDHYPRGSKELTGPFHRWQPSDTVEWFAQRGVALKTESDGRMFPTTDSSQTIVDCLLDTARDESVKLCLRTGIDRVELLDTGCFSLHGLDKKPIEFDRLILATGGGRDSAGHRIAQSMGHSLSKLAPSLFTFHIRDPLIKDLQGLSVPSVAVECPAVKLSQSGPLLVTHWGLSGPAILKLSAWGARAFAQLDYRFEIRVNWTRDLDRAKAVLLLIEAKQQHGAKQIGSYGFRKLPRRLWDRMLRLEGIAPETKFAQVSLRHLDSLAEALVAYRFSVEGKSMNKEEFVTCGGVELREVDFKRMESKLVPHLYFAGETLDIDGVTGGFNFQAAWTTGRIAGTCAAK